MRERSRWRERVSVKDERVKGEERGREGKGCGRRESKGVRDREGWIIRY